MSLMVIGVNDMAIIVILLFTIVLIVLMTTFLYWVYSHSHKKRDIHEYNIDKMLHKNNMQHQQFIKKINAISKRIDDVSVILHRRYSNYHI